MIVRPDPPLGRAVRLRYNQGFMKLPRPNNATWRAAPALLACAIVAAGCDGQFLAGPSAPLAVQVAGEMTEVRPTLMPADADLLSGPTTGTVRLTAAANETVSLQVIVDADLAGLSGLTVGVSDLTSGDGAVVSAEQIELFRMGVVTVTEPAPWSVRLGRDVGRGDYYDMLIPASAPIGGMPYTLGPNERLALWVDIHLPRDAAAGRYTGAMTVTGRVGAIRKGAPTAATVPLTLTVHDFVLPDTRPITVLGGFDHRDLFGAFLLRGGMPFRPVWMDRSDPDVKRGLVIMRQLMTLAHRHHLDLFETALRPVLKRDLTGKVVLHWDDYEAIVMPYLDGAAFADRIGCAAWPAPVSAHWPDPDSYGGLDSPAYRRTAGAIIAATAKWYADKKMADRLVFWPVRKAPAPGDYTRLAAWAGLIRAAAPEALILTRLPPNPPAATGWRAPAAFAEWVQMVAPPAHLLDPDRQVVAPSSDQPLAGAYLGPGRPPYMPPMEVGASAADVRAIPWLAMRGRLRGLVLADVLGFDGGSTTGLFYPGKSVGLDEVLPSVRLKRLRRGMQDAALLRLLIQRGGGQAAQRVLYLMARYVGLQAAGDHYLDARLHGWANAPAAWEQARQLLAAEILAAGAAAPANPLALRLGRRRLAEAVGSVLLERVATRVDPTGEIRPGAELAVRISVDLFNPAAGPAAVKLWLPPAPEGFRLTAPVATAQLPPAGRTTLTLGFACLARSAGSDGKITVPIRMTVNGQSTRAVPVAVGLLLSSAAAAAVTVDGDLSEWPARTGNTAAVFRLLGRLSRHDESLPAQPTLAFVQHDERYLYLALRCNLPRGADPTADPTNRVRYDGLLGWGEDMVEVVLDPGAKARAPADLYRLVIKANGVHITGRGVPSDPPVGPAGYWPADVRVAVRRDGDVMFYEAAIPRSAFGRAGSANLWRINFGRFSRSDHQASNWAESPRHCYDPASMGSLLLFDDESPD